eukprot:scaffold50144_cov63-Phaeocystis_antarctica.AAC.1
MRRDSAAAKQEAPSDERDGVARGGRCFKECHNGKLYYMATGRGHCNVRYVHITSRDTYGAEITDHHGRTLLRMTPLAPAPVARP